MDDENQVLRLGFDADTSQIANAVSALKSYLDVSNQVSDSQEELAQSADDAGQALDRSLSSTFAQLRTQAQDTSDELDSLRDSIKGVKEEADTDDGGGGGSLGLSGLRRTGGALSQLGLSGIGGDVSRIGDIGQVTQELKQLSDTLPDLAQNIPLVSDAAEALTPILGEDAAAFVAIGGPVVLVTGAVAALNASYEAQKKAAEEANNAVLASLDAQTQYNTIIASGSEEAVKGAQKTLEQTKAGADATLATLQPLQKQLSDTLNDPLQQALRTAEHLETLLTGGPGDAVVEQFQKSIIQPIIDKLSATGDYTKEQLSKLSPQDILQDLNTEVTKLQGTSGQAAEGLKAYQDALSSGKLTQDQTTQTLKDQTSAVLASVAAQAQGETQIAALRRDGTEKQLESLKETNQAQQQSDQDALASLQKYQSTLDKSSDDYKAVQAQIDSYNTDLGNLKESFVALSDPTLKVAVDANDAAKAQQKLVEESAKDYQQYLKDTASANEQYASDISKTNSDYYAKIQDIAAQATKQATDLLEKLLEKDADLKTSLLNQEADDATKLQQQELGDTIKYQREQVKLAQDHENKLAQIIKDAKEQQENLIANRDFSGLFNLKKTTDDKIQAENDQYAQSRQAQLDAFNQQEDDEKRHYAEQEQQRLVDYNRQLAAAQLQYQRQSAQDAQNQKDTLNKAQNAYNQQLAALDDKHAQELQKLKDNAVAQYTLLTETDDELLKTQAQYYAALKGMATNALNSVASGLTGGSASGGGNPSLTSSLNGPNYRGNTGGNTTSTIYNQQSATVTIPINGADHPIITANAVKALIAQQMKEYLG